jgi:hypothetical protein
MTRDVPASRDVPAPGEARPSGELRRGAPVSRESQPTALATEPAAAAAFADTQVPPRSVVPAPVTSSPRGEMSADSSPRVEPSPRAEPSSRVEPALSPRVDPPARERAAVTTAPRSSFPPATTARAGREPSRPYTWDESIDEAARIGHDIKDAFTSLGRKIKGVFRRD